MYGTSSCMSVCISAETVQTSQADLEQYAVF